MHLFTQTEHFLTTNRNGAIEKALFGPMNVVLKDTLIVRKDLAMIIDAPPRFAQAFFRPVLSGLTRPQFHHLWVLVLGILLSLRRPKLIHLAAACPGHAHRTAHGAFLAHSDWDAGGLLDDEVRSILRRMKPRRREMIYLLIDDTRIPKRGRKMFGVSKIWDHKQQRFVHGHFVVTAANLFRGVTLPWRFDLWLPKRWAGRSYRKSTEIAAQMIRSFEPPRGLKVRVLFDAFYLCPTVTKACQARGFTWFSVASRNRTLTRTWGVGQKIGDLGPGLLKYAGRHVRMPRARGRAKLRIASVDGRLARIGDVRLVISKRPRSSWKTMVTFATNETGLTAREIVSVYEKRWAIEVLFKELRGHLGLGDYQVLSKDAIQRHLHLCGLAHLLLTHHGMDAVGAQARKAKGEVPLPTMSERLAALRDDVRRDQLRKLFRRGRHRTLYARIEEYLRAA
jgi:SRSO17 transposase